jgi:hypothetical protein
MDSDIGFIFLFAGNFAPRNFALCQGQLMSIAQNSALFSILGTTYGGNGVSTFGLPDLRGRTAVGQGQGPGLSQYDFGRDNRCRKRFYINLEHACTQPFFTGKYRRRYHRYARQYNLFGQRSVDGFRAECGAIKGVYHHCAKRTNGNSVN